MKNFILSVCATLVFLLVLAQTVVLSQEPSQVDETAPETVESTSETSTAFDEALVNYQNEFEVYTALHDDYLFKKAQHQRFNTLTSRQELQSATVAMLAARDNVVISYLLAVKERVTGSIGVPQETQDALIVRLDEEVGWYSDHRDTIPSAGTLEDLQKDSAEARARWNTTPRLVYETLATVAHGKILEFTDRTDEVFVRVKDKIEEIRAEDREDYSISDEKLDVLNRWVFETDNRIARSKERRADAERMISNLSRSGGLSSYNEIITILGQTQLYLKEANTFMGEIIREIKTKE